MKSMLTNRILTIGMNSMEGDLKITDPERIGWPLRPWGAIGIFPESDPAS